MKEIRLGKKLLSFLLIFSMVLTLIPASLVKVEAATGEVIDAAVFASDIHGDDTNVTKILNAVKGADSSFNPSTVSFVGDTDMSTSEVTSTVQAVYSNAKCFYAYGSHDSGKVTDETGILYGDSNTNYYIYSISQSDMENSSSASTAAKTFTTEIANLDTTKPLFIVSHMPLHARRGDNNGAATWYSAISAAAETMDIVFFWAHNHTGESSVDTDAYYVEKDGSETISIQGGSTVTPNFTYMNAGYIDANGQNPERKPVATTVKIYDDALVFQDYTTTGTFTGTYSHNVEVAREFAGTNVGVKTLSSLTLSNVKEMYMVGETFVEPTITAVYTEGSTKELTEDYIISGYDTSKPGKQTVTVSYTEGEVTKTETFDIYVASSKALTNVALDETVTFTVGTAMDASKLTVKLTYTYYLSETATADLNYDEKTNTITDYEIVNGTDSRISITEDVDLQVNDQITISATDATDTVSTTYTVASSLTDEVGIIVREATKQPNGWVEASDDEESSNNVTLGGSTTVKKTVYVLTNSITSGTSYLIANTNSAGNGYVVKNNSGSVAATGVTVKTDDKIGTYIELTDATNELWYVGSSSSSYTLKNDSYYLYHDSGNLSLQSSGSKNTWNLSSNYIRYTGGKTTRYLTYSSGWTLTSSSANVYFYVPTEVEITEDGTVEYSVSANNIEHIYDTDNTTLETENIVASLLPTGSEATLKPGGYSYSIVSDDNGIIDTNNTNGSTIRFTGNEGEAKVRVYYTWTVDGTEYKIWNTITVTAKQPYYVIDITHDGDNNAETTDTSVTNTIALKGIKEGDTYNLNHVLTLFGANGEEDKSSETVKWSSSNSDIATVDEATGLVTLTGKGGQANITVTYQIDSNTSVTDTIKLTAAINDYFTPTDGGNNFPEYPNEGAVRFDKTASAIGNFSQTGIVEVELSMTGVPYTTGNEIDVVIMLDMTGSMSDTAMTAAEESAIAFAEQIVKNEDGTYNSNRIAILAFNSSSSSPFTYWSLGKVSNDTEWDNLCTKVRAASEDQTSGGTPYDEALSKCQEILDAAKTDGTGNNRQQFCVFVSDGGPTSYEYITNYDAVKAGTATTYTTSSASATGGSNQSDSNFATIATYTHEYYSILMKDSGVTMFSVLTGLSKDDYPNCATILENIASDSTKAYVVEDGTDTSAVSGALTNIAQEILEAAKDVTVIDKITDEYTMIFDIPTGDVNISDAIPNGQEFYIEVLEYTLDANKERITTNPKSLTKLYLGTKNSRYYAASDSTGTEYSAPTFEETAIGNMYYWSTDSTKGNQGISITVDGSTYYFTSKGDGNYNMTSGAYADGIISSTTNTSTDLVIATPHFVYNASTKMLVWTAEKLSNTELALSYFLYLDNSATEVGENKEIDAATYPTNEYATITYTNHLGNKCYQEFPIPQMTWNGAQVTYVFYLVNAAGQPVNKAGQVVDFANAIFVTAPVTKSVVWNTATEEGTATLDVKVAANEVLPEGYDIFDESATYEIHVFEKETGELAGTNRFVINGSETNGLKSSTTKVYNTKAGTKYSAYGTYSSSQMDGVNTVTDDIDYANTTVAFAVTWTAKLVEDSIVVDYGLPVGIHILSNDMVQATLNSISKTGYDSKYSLNTGIADNGFAKIESLKLDNGDIVTPYGDAIYYVQKDMEFNEVSSFYYDAEVTYYKDSNKQTGYIHSKVNVIPATTVYYEDNFVSYKSYSSDGSEITDADSEYYWKQEETTNPNKTQGEDRPGQGLLNDANNIYGYDSAYLQGSSTYSNGSAMKVHVDANSYATATFSFYGTGFDIISLTSNLSGSIVVNVKNDDSSYNKNMFVDTYYGYTYSDKDGWQLTESTDESALYQIPVVKASGLTYDHYTVTITATYSEYFDHNNAVEGYDFYLDAIRIYNPANDGSEDSTILDAYKSDNEAYPTYFELKDLLIDAKTYDSLGTDTISGLVFIDGIGNSADIGSYQSYGPNNEVYLAKNQSIAFKLNTNVFKDSQGNDLVPTGVQIGLKSATGNEINYKLFNVKDGETVNLEKISSKSLTTSTDMYYNIKDLSNDTIVISNVGEGILSITNIKFTFDNKATYQSSPIVVSEPVVTYALRSLRYVAPTTFVPEVFEVTVDETVAVGTNVNVNVTTSSDVEYIYVNDSIVSSYVEKDGLRTFTTTLPTTEVGTMEVFVKAYNIDELEAETQCYAEVVVTEKTFTPKTFEVDAPYAELINKKFKVTVKTSTDVEYITVNGETFTSFKTNKAKGTRTWTINLTAKQVGKFNVDVVAYDKDNTASETITEVVEITSVKKIIKDIIDWIFG